MTKVSGKTSDSLFPLPVMLISCADRTGARNLITLAWVAKVCMEPPMLAIAVTVRMALVRIKNLQSRMADHAPTE